MWHDLWFRFGERAGVTLHCLVLLPQARHKASLKQHNDCTVQLCLQMIKYSLPFACFKKLFARNQTIQQFSQ